MSRVFVVQNQHYYDKAEGRLVPKFDLSSAEQYGELIFLLGPGAAPFNPVSPIAELNDKLADYGDEDYLLLIGNPCLIGWTVAIAADSNNGFVNLLQWSGKDQSYIPISASLFPDCPEE